MLHKNHSKLVISQELIFCPYNSSSWSFNASVTEKEVYKQTEDKEQSIEFSQCVLMTSLWMNLLQTSLLYKSPGLTCLWGALWPLWVYLSADWALLRWKDWIQCYWSVWALFLNQDFPRHRNDLVKKYTILHFRQQSNVVKPLCVEFNCGLESV